MKDKTVLVSTPVVYRRDTKGLRWFVVKTAEDGDWELPKTIARRGESSVRASIRMLAEQGAMDAKILEEIGRSGGATKVNGKPVSQRSLFYLMEWEEGSNEVLGFADADWLQYSKAVRKLTAKRDQQMLREGNKLLKTLGRN